MNNIPRHAKLWECINDTKLREIFYDNFCVDEPNKCWPYKGAIMTLGYGTVAYTSIINGVKLKVVKYAHIIAYCLHHKVLPKQGQEILHKCDNPLCCNPSHLMIGSHDDNMKDKVSKNRQCKGETHGKSSLSVLLINQIFNDKKEGLSQGELAIKYKLHQSTISRILHRKRWKHLVENTNGTLIAMLSP